MALVLTVPSASPTEAAFTDAEHTSATLTAYRVPRPVIASPCTLNTGLIGITPPSITVEWTLPTGYALSDARYGTALGAGAMTEVTTGVSTTLLTGRRYRTVFTGGLLGGLLGGSASVGIRLHDTAKNNWTSAWATATGSATLAGLFPSCSVNA
jgi:hypothetical protein